MKYTRFLKRNSDLGLIEETKSAYLGIRVNRCSFTEQSSLLIVCTLAVLPYL